MLNEIFAGAVGQLALYPTGASEAQLNDNINDLNQLEANYVLGEFNDTYDKENYVAVLSTSRSKPKATGETDSVEIQRDGNGNITKYTQFGPNGELMKEVRITGKEHGNIPRPNVKEPKYNTNPKTGEQFQNGYEVRPAEPWEIPSIRPIP